MFLFELLVQSIGLYKSYLYSFFFWMETLAANRFWQQHVDVWQIRWMAFLESDLYDTFCGLLRVFLRAGVEILASNFWSTLDTRKDYPHFTSSCFMAYLQQNNAKISLSLSMFFFQSGNSEILQRCEIIWSKDLCGAAP